MENKNTIIWVLAVVVVVIGGVWLVMGGLDRGGDTATRSYERVPDNEHDFEFAYYSGSEGYTLIESPDDTPLGIPEVVKVYSLFDSEDYAAQQQSEETAGDSSPSITIIVFTAPEAPVEGATDQIGQWAMAHNNFTAYGLRTSEPEEVEINGATGIKYRADGLYPNETYIMKHSDYYYVFIGQYNSEEDDIRKAFEELIGEVYFL